MDNTISKDSMSDYAGPHSTWIVDAEEVATFEL
jgi:hypothetical protein